MYIVESFLFCRMAERKDLKKVHCPIIKTQYFFVGGYHIERNPITGAARLVTPEGIN